MYSIEDHVDHHHVVFTLLSHDNYMHYMYLLYVIVYFILHNSVNVDMCTVHVPNMKCVMSISCFFTCFILIANVYCIHLAPAVSSVYNPSSPPIRLQRPHDPPPYASSETTPMRLDPSSSSSYQDTNYHHHGVIPQTQYRDVVGQSLPESAPPPPTSTLQQYNNNRELQREGYQPDHHRAKLVMSLSLCLSLSLSLSFCLFLSVSLFVFSLCLFVFVSLFVPSSSPLVSHNVLHCVTC